MEEPAFRYCKLRYISRLLPFCSFGPYLCVQMSTAPSPTTGKNPKKPICLLSLGRCAFILLVNRMLISGIDAGGPQGVSQLLILKNVMEKLSRDENGDPQGPVKRPCEVFDMIGGVGTGG
jgi:hypothetical protein